MRCLYCGATSTRVLDSRPSRNGQEVRRRRQCGQCNARFTTIEKAEAGSIWVVKKSGEKEPFSREKLLRGLQLASRNRDIGPDQLDQLVERVEATLRQDKRRPVPSSRIGEVTLGFLRKMDDIAFIRFASVYHSFSDLRDFRDLLTGLIEEGQAAAGEGTKDP